MTEVNALSDQHITVKGKDILVPAWAPNLSAVYAMGDTITKAQITTPSLRKGLMIDVPILEPNANPQEAPRYLDLFENPKTLTPGEGMRALVAEGAGGAELEFVGVWLSGAFVDAPAGEVVIVKATGTTTLVANTWTQVELTFAQQLEAGNWAIVGMRAFGATVVLARLIIPGSAHRPGVIAHSSEKQENQYAWSPKVLGTWGTFEHTFPPQLECLATAADTAQTVYLALVKLTT